MWELYVDHPIVGEIFLTVAYEHELDSYPEVMNGLPVKYRYIE